MKRPMPCAGDTIHVDGEEIGRMRGYPHRWSAKVLAVIDDREVSGTTLLVCRRWNRFKCRHEHWVIDDLEWKLSLRMKIGPLPRKT